MRKYDEHWTLYVSDEYLNSIPETMVTNLELKKIFWKNLKIKKSKISLVGQSLPYPIQTMAMFAIVV